MIRKHRGNNLLSSSSPHAAAVTQWRQTTSLSLYLSHALYTSLYNVILITTHKDMCPKSYLYISDFSAYLRLYPSNRSEPIGAGSVMSRFSATSIRFHPEGHVFPTNSPFTPAWNVVPIRSAFGKLAACRESAPWSACLTCSRSCGSSSARTLVPLLAPGSNGISTGYALSWNGRPRSSQGG